MPIPKYVTNLIFNSINQVFSSGNRNYIPKANNIYLFKSYKKIVIFILIACLSSSIYSQVFHNEDERIKSFSTTMDEDKLLDFCHVLVDTSDMLTINDLLKMDSECFTPAKQIGKELNPKFKYWATINISNSDSIVSYWLIELCLADYIELYQFDQNGKLVISKKSGELISQSEHDFIDLLYSFRIKIPPNTTVKLFFKFWNDNTYPVFLSPHIRPEVEMYRWLYERNLKEFAIQGLFFGALIIMMLYNFLIFLTTREKTYGFYSLYILAITLLITYIENR